MPNFRPTPPPALGPPTPPASPPAAAPTPESPARRAPAGWTARTARPAHDCSRAGILGLLELLGVRLERRQGRHPPAGCRAHRGGLAALWRRPEHEILDILAAARAAYLSEVKQHSADHERMILLNLAWRRVCRIFRRRGYELDAPPRRD